MSPFTPEAWLRGPIDGVSPYIAPTLYAFQQSYDDVSKHTEDLTVEQIWFDPDQIAPVGFHMRHIAGSVDRLTTYLEGQQLSQAQLAALESEKAPGDPREQLLALMQASFSRSEKIFRSLDPARLTDPRSVGRKQLPTTVIGLLVHIAEHTARHTGQCVTTAKLVRHVDVSQSIVSVAHVPGVVSH